MYIYIVTRILFKTIVFLNTHSFLDFFLFIKVFFVKLINKKKKRKKEKVAYPI